MQDRKAPASATTTAMTLDWSAFRSGANVVAGHSRSKNGVASLAIQHFFKRMDLRITSVHDGRDSIKSRKPSSLARAQKKSRDHAPARKIVSTLNFPNIKIYR